MLLLLAVMIGTQACIFVPVGGGGGHHHHPSRGGGATLGLLEPPFGLLSYSLAGCDYLRRYRLRRAARPSPTIVEPKRRSVAGSGTGSS